MGSVRLLKPAVFVIGEPRLSPHGVADLDEINHGVVCIPRDPALPVPDGNHVQLVPGLVPCGTVGVGFFRYPVEGVIRVAHEASFRIGASCHPAGRRR